MTRQSGSHRNRNPNRPRSRERSPREEMAGPRRTTPQENGRSAPGARREEARNPGGRMPREPQGREHQRTSGLPGARGPWTRCRHGVGHPAHHKAPPTPPKRAPLTSLNSRTRRWVPRHGERPKGVQSLPDPFERGDDSKDDQGVSRHGGHGPEPLRVSEPSTWQRWPDVQPAAPVNDECPRERAVESLI